MIDVEKLIVAFYKELESIEEPVVTVAIDNALETMGLMIVGDKIVKMNPEEPTPKFRVGDCMRLKKEAEQGIRDGLPFVNSIKDGIYYCNNEIIPVSKQDDYEYPPFCRANDTLTEFEQCLKSGTNIYVEQGRRMEDWDAKEDAKELLSIARVQDDVSGLVLDREDGESNISYLERCLVPKMRNVWYEAAKEIREKEQKKHEAELEQAYNNSDEVQYRCGYRKAIADSIEFIYEQLQEGTIGCGNIEEFIDNYRKIEGE